MAKRVNQLAHELPAVSSEMPPRTKSLWRHRLLQQRNRELESAVCKRTAELETERGKVLEEKKRADEANEAKGRFLAHMSQTPPAKAGGSMSWAASEVPIGYLTLRH